MNIGVNPNSRKNSNLMKNMTDSYAVSKFVEHFRENGCPSLKVDRWSDKENSATPDIDAIAGPFAIEHTSVDTLLNQRKYGDWFKRVIANLESEYSGRFPFSLFVWFEYEAFRVNRNLKIIHNALTRFILEDSLLLKWGHHKLDRIPGIPFTLYVHKSCESRPFRLIFARSYPQELSLGLPWCQDKKQSPLPDNFRAQLDKKAAKLAKYKACGETKVLLIENPDFLKDDQTLLHWITKAYLKDFPAVIDRIWCATRYSWEFRFSELTSDVRRDT